MEIFESLLNRFCQVVSERELLRLEHEKLKRQLNPPKAVVRKKKQKFYLN